jgi:uncharacterized membrane protein
MEMELDPEEKDQRPPSQGGTAAGPQGERRAVSPAEFATLMSHFYRGEISRSNIWRQRLDTTFNWAVLTTGTALTFSFGSPEAPHVVILFTSVLMVVFLFIEARRYRYYEVWSSRIRIIETDYIAPVLSPRCRASTPHDAWREMLAEDLLRPHFTVGMWEAVGRRLRRNYFWIFLLLAGSWVVKIAVHPTPSTSARDFMARAAIGQLDGWIVIAIGFIFNGLLAAIAFLTINLNQAGGEVSAGRRWRFRPFPARRPRPKVAGPGTTGTFKPLARRPNTGTLEARGRVDADRDRESDETPVVK